MKNAGFINRKFLRNGAMILFSATFIFTSCQNDPYQEPTPVSVKEKQPTEDLSAQARSSADKVAKNFVAPMEGDQEVPSVDTKARGNTVFNLREDGLHYRLIVANIENVRMAHIHLAPPGQNGPVVVWLYPSAPPPMLIPDRFSGILATGVITTEDLVGPLAGFTLDDLLEEMRAGNTYVNVHTEQYPGGEIRGQIKPAGPK